MDGGVELYKFEQGAYQCLSEEHIKLSGNESIELPLVGAVQGCNYYVKVSHRSWVSDVVGETYRIRSSFQASEYYEREENGSYADATVMQPDQSYTGVRGKDGDKDFYKITAPANGRLTFFFEHAYQDSYDKWNVEIYKYEQGAYQCLSERNIKLLDNEKIELPLVGAEQGADYYVRVQGEYSNSIVGHPYTIRNTFQPSAYYERETNDSYATATELSLNKTYHGTLNRYYDVDFWKIRTTKGGQLRISFGHVCKGSSDGWNVHVYQYANGEYRELNNATIHLNDTKTVNLQNISVDSNGTYYVKVDGSGDSSGEEYSLKVQYTVDRPAYLHASATGKKAKLSWGAVKGADGYELYVKKPNSSSYQKIADVKKTSYTYKKLSRKVTTQFRVRAYIKNGNKKSYSKFSYVLKVKA